MKFFRNLNAQQSAEAKTTIVLLAGMIFLLTSIGALNGGTALAASVWDGLKTTIEGVLQSTFVLAMSLIVLLVAVWQVTHGRGYGQVGLVIGVLAVALIGPSLVTSVATATREPEAVGGVHASALLRSPLQLTQIEALRQ